MDPDLLLVWLFLFLVFVILMMIMMMIVVAVLVLWSFVPKIYRYEHRRPGIPKKPLEYKLKPMVFFRLSGRLYADLTWLVRVPLIRNIIIGLVIRLSNLDLFRHIQLEDFPTILPIGPLPSEYPVDTKQEMQLENFLEVSLRQNSQDTGFKFINIADLYNAYRSNKVTPLEVAQRALAAIEETNSASLARPKLRAFVQVNEDEVIKMARSSTERFETNMPLSFLDGIPVAVKEKYDVVPYYTSNGTMFMDETVATRDASVVKKLRDGGAIILGITNMHELGVGTTGNNINWLHGIPRNPYNTGYYTGGSSSGSAAAVALGICPIAIGSDEGGSVRIPAAACGVVGLKASYGRISCSGMKVHAHSVTHTGAICTNVRDAALVYAFLAGPDEHDKNTLRQPHVSLDHCDDSSLKGFFLGVDWTFLKDTDPAVSDECEKVLLYLETKGARIVDIQIPELEETRVAHVISIASEMATNLKEEFDNHFFELNPDSRFSLAVGRQITTTDYFQAQKQRTRTMKFLQDIFENQRIDCIITPGLGIKVPAIPDSALSHGEVDLAVLGGMMRFCQLGNLTGIPGITLPVGYDERGLPISLQVMSAWWQEHVMIRVAMAAEGYINKRRPKCHFPLL